MRTLGIGDLPETPVGFSWEAGADHYDFAFEAGGGAKVAVRDGALLFFPERSAAQKQLLALLGG